MPRRIFWVRYRTVSGKEQTATVYASDRRKALELFWQTHPEATEVLSALESC